MIPKPRKDINVSSLFLNIAKSEHEIQFLYQTRKNPEIDSMLSGDPPENMSQHKDFISKVQGKTRWIYVAKVRNIIKGNQVEPIVGYSQVYSVTDMTVEIGFAVHPKYQGQGHGKDLVLKTISKAENMFPDKTVILYVLRNNKKAIHIYEKLGFTIKDLPETDSKTLGMELLR